MKLHSYTSIQSIGKSALLLLLLAGVLFVVYVVIEPVVSRSQSDVFTVSQTIDAEISFNASTTDVSMTPSISSLTGGTSTGATQVVINTNNAAGYQLAMAFSTSTAMQGNANGGEIPNYAPSTPGTPDFTFSVPVNTAGFGYTVEASSTLDIDDTFEDDGGGDCSGSGTFTVDRCYLNPSTTAQTIVNRSTVPPTSGGTSTIKFQLVVQPNPTPAIPSDTYVATATLTATTN